MRRILSTVLALFAGSITWPVPPAESGSDHDWLMYQHDIRRTGFNQHETKINRTSAALLHLKCAFTVDVDLDDPANSTLGPEEITATPAVVSFADFEPGTDGDQPRKVVYIGAADSKFYAVDAEDCSKIWATSFDPIDYLAYQMFVTSAFVDLDAGRLYIGGGFTMYALDLYDGHVVWQFSTAPSNGAAELESSPVMFEGKVYFGSDGDTWEENTPPSSRYPAVYALNADTGGLEWYWRPSHVMSGPSSPCGDVWSSIAVDPEEGLLYFDTSDCTRRTQGLYNEAVIALPIDKPADCAAGVKTNCFNPTTKERTDAPNWYYQPRIYDPYDYDFGSSPLLFDVDGGKLLGVGGKDGFYYVIQRGKNLNPPNGGESRCPKWKKQVVRGGFAAGFIGSTAVDHQSRLFGATALFDTVFPGPNPQAQPPFLHAFNGQSDDGDILWQQVTSGPSFAATTVVPGVVFLGSLEGTIQAFDAETGQVLWISPSLGTISSGAAVSDGEVFVGGGTRGMGLGQPAVTNGLHVFSLLPGAPEEIPDVPPKLPVAATWPLGVVEYPFPDGIVTNPDCP